MFRIPCAGANKVGEWQYTVTLIYYELRNILI